MNNSIESIAHALLNPPEAARVFFGGTGIDAQEARKQAGCIMERRALAIISAGSACPPGCIGYVQALSSSTLSASACRDAISQLRGRIGSDSWDQLYRAFIDSRGPSDSDNYV